MATYEKISGCSRILGTPKFIRDEIESTKRIPRGKAIKKWDQLLNPWITSDKGTVLFLFLFLFFNEINIHFFFPSYSNILVVVSEINSFKSTQRFRASEHNNVFVLFFFVLFFFFFFFFFSFYGNLFI